MIQLTVWFDEFIFVWFYKNENGLQIRTSGAKTELLRREGATTWSVIYPHSPTCPLVRIMLFNPNWSVSPGSGPDI